MTYIADFLPARQASTFAIDRTDGPPGTDITPVDDVTVHELDEFERELRRAASVVTEVASK
ncbi:MAG: hypothetical protein CTY20_00645 [Hyphomicrobium sp.]|nr:MAG: hypothetical protein CTY20_00645 [Hyphomicrobium sp.]